ncbi:MAG: hypothetical protein ACE5JO_13025 [Candidatus Binatia bacterium]
MAYSKKGQRFLIYTRAILSVVIVLLSAACEGRQTDKVTDYFWPLHEGQTFVYELLPTGNRTVKIASIKKDPKRGVIVETEETLRGFDLPVPNPVIKRAFRIAPTNDVIYLVNLSADNSLQEEIYLKAPIKRGVHWPVSWIFVEPRIMGKPEGTSSQRTEAVRGTGSCRIEDIDTQHVLGKDVSCVEVRCSFSHTELYESRLFHCKGVGYIGTEITQTFRGRKLEPEWLERLVETR